MKKSGNRWAKLSRRLRITKNQCEICANRVNLETAHLYSRSELKRFHIVGAFHDERNLSVLCKLCHVAFDSALGLHVLTEEYEGRWGRYTRGFVRVLYRRSIFLIVAQKESLCFGDQE